MITQGQFNRAMQEINESFAKLLNRVTELETALKEQKSASQKVEAKKKAA